MDRPERSPMTPDAEIIARALGGDLQAYGALVDRYERVVLAAAWAVLRDRHAAEDVTQEVLTRGYLKLGELRDGSRFVFWLLKMARREAYRVRHERERTRYVAGDVLARVSEEGSRGQLLDDEKERLLLQVQRLPAQEQIVLSLRYFAGHSVREIAAMTQRPMGTVTKQLSRAVERLRTWMGATKLQTMETKI